MQVFATELEVLEPYAVACAWLLFALIFFIRKKPPQTSETVRDRRSLIGLLLQIVGYVIVRLGLRAPAAGFLNLGPFGDVGAAVVAIGFMAASLYLTYAAVKTLGKQWSLAARLVQEHQLVTEGPYRLVRHPIYTAMFGMLIGTAIAVSQWQALIISTAVFLFGTMLRIRAEEQLLLDAFGNTYRNYAHTVPALIPWWHGV
jgi:protein-S-isoprenylcysteine O-methyltransferase Ste14